MPAFIGRYIHIITQEANALLENKFEKLTPLQGHAIGSILQHTEELSRVTAMLGETRDNAGIRHSLLDILTPIAGYVDMLSDGWMGDLNQQQHDRIKLIYAAVHRLTKYIRSYPVENKQPLTSR